MLSGETGSLRYAPGGALSLRVQLVKRIFNICDQFYWGSGASADAPALAYYLLISLAPFLLGVTALAARLYDTDRLIEDITLRASDQLPQELQVSLVEIIQHAQRSSGILLLLAIVGCLWTCSGAVGVLVRCKHRLLSKSPYHPTIGRLREMGLAGLVLVLVVVMVGMGAVAGGVLGRLGIEISDFEAGAIAWVATLAVLLLLYSLGPRDRLSFRSALAGAVPASLLLQVVPLVVSLYTQYATGAVNAAQLFLILVLLVVGCTLSAQIMLGGAVLACMHKRGIKLSQLSSLSLVE